MVADGWDMLPFYLFNKNLHFWSRFDENQNVRSMTGTELQYMTLFEKKLTSSSLTSLFLELCRALLQGSNDRRVGEMNGSRWVEYAPILPYAYIYKQNMYIYISKISLYL